MVPLGKVLGVFGARASRASRFARNSRTESTFLHARSAGHPRAELRVPIFEVTHEDIALTERLTTAFDRARGYEAGFQRDQRPTGDLWHKIRDESQGSLIHLLLRRDLVGAAEILVNGFQHDVARGFSQGLPLLQGDLHGNDRERVATAATKIIDRFVAFAEALAVLQVEFPEWGRWGENMYVDLADLYDRVEQAAGLTLSIPGCFGLYGVCAGKHVIHATTPPHAYAAWRMHQTLKGTTEARVGEIGGGFGGCAYYALQAHVGSYTIIDLPLANVLQGFFLAKTCGASQVRLYGEPDTGQQLQVMPYWVMEDMPNGCFDLVLSQESLPEIQRDKAQAYIAQIARTSRYLLSMNQETAAGVGFQEFRHNIVPELVAEHGGFERLYRFPYWLRRGQVEELYEIR